ncbi:MAG: D-tyrosyl-tRNA(Tyr) deacylase [Prevotellaceae bacterium]|jgi:D-tyrosyl-tRNA(Tyr) deacylase|nr:D-tyrosyl-tRNA(Tyr) deacylase [Prevotellaceae bacterium]
MRALIQRVTQASVIVGGEETGRISAGLFVLAGFETSDTSADADAAAAKICKLRVFDDRNGMMNLSLVEFGGSILVVSQFTLHAQTRKGNRPSYFKAAPPEAALPLYKRFIEALARYSGVAVQTGVFGAYMQVAIVNDGPVTIMIDTKSGD